MESKLTLVCTKCTVEKLTDDFSKNKTKKGGFQSQCKDCEKFYRDNNKEQISETCKKYYILNKKKMYEYREENKERKNEYDKKYREENKERINTNGKKWYQENKERVAETGKKWYEENKERRLKTGKKWSEENKERKAETGKKWREENPEKRTANSSKRRSKKLQACPSWLTKDDEMKIEGLYSKARQMSLDTGITHHVDHFIPLIHPLVCGFHCFSNLRVITAKENLAKGNKFTPFIESDSGYSE